MLLFRFFLFFWFWWLLFRWFAGVLLLAMVPCWLACLRVRFFVFVLCLLVRVCLFVACVVRLCIRCLFALCCSVLLWFAFVLCAIARFEALDSAFPGVLR